MYRKDLLVEGLFADRPRATFSLPYKTALIRLNRKQMYSSVVRYFKRNASRRFPAFFQRDKSNGGAETDTFITD